MHLSIYLAPYLCHTPSQASELRRKLQESDQSKNLFHKELTYAKPIDPLTSHLTLTQALNLFCKKLAHVYALLASKPKPKPKPINTVEQAQQQPGHHTKQ